MLSFHSLARTGAIVLLGHGAVAVIGMVALRLYTELAPPAVFGEANLVLAVLSLGLQLFVAPFTAAQLRYHTDAVGRGMADQFTQETATWALRSTALLAIVSAIAFLVWHAIGSQAPGLWVLLAGIAWLFVNSLRNVFMSRLHAERRQVTYIGLQVAEAVLLVGFTAVALHLLDTTPSYLVAQALAVAALLGLLTWAAPWPIWKRDRNPPAESAGLLGHALAYGLPFAPMSLLSWTATIADRYVIAFLLGAGAAGQYLAPNAICSKGMALSNGALNDLFRPMLFDAANQKGLREAKRLLLVWLAASAGIGLLAVVFIYYAGTVVAALLLAEEYRSTAVGIMLWTAMAYSVFGLTQVLETALLSLNRSSALLMPMALSAASNVGLCFILVPLHGVIGAAQASLGSFLIRCVATGAVFYAALRLRRAMG